MGFILLLLLFSSSRPLATQHGSTWMGIGVAFSCGKGHVGKETEVGQGCVSLMPTFDSYGSALHGGGFGHLTPQAL